MDSHDYRLPERGAVVLLALGAACSSLPEPEMQRHADHDIVAVYEFEGPAHAIRLPTSGPDLTIYELLVEPDLPQRFHDHAPWVEPDPATGTVRVHCRFRSWASTPVQGAVVRPPPTPIELFPGATRIEMVQTP